MGINGTRVPVTSAVTPLSSVTDDSISGQSITVRNPSDSGSVVDLGGSTVATGAGFALPPGAAIVASLDPGERLYAVAPADTTVSLLVLETGV